MWGPLFFNPGTQQYLYASAPAVPSTEDHDHAIYSRRRQPSRHPVPKLYQGYSHDQFAPAVPSTAAPYLHPLEVTINDGTHTVVSGDIRIYDAMGRVYPVESIRQYDATGGYTDIGWPTPMMNVLSGGQANTPIPVVSIAAIELNGKKLARVNAPAYQSGYLAACAAKLPSHIRYFRENSEGMPSTAGVAYNWSSTACSWVGTMAAEPFFKGYVWETLGDGLMAADNWGATGEAQVRWRCRQLIDHLGTNLKAILVPGNEPDNLPFYNANYAVGSVSQATALDRMLTMARIVYEERGSSPVALMGPSLAFPTWSGGAGVFNMIDLLGRNNNEILGYLDGIDTHPHTGECTRWHNFDGSAPSDGALSSHHVGRVLAALGVQLPWTPFESGYAFDNNEADGTNSKYRFGSHFCALLRYACSWWSLYCHAQSGHDAMNISEPTPPFAKRAWYDAATQISEPTQYLLPADGQLTITAKTSTAFQAPPWIVCAPHDSTGFPVEFSRVTMTAGNIHCASGGRNIVARPIWLPATGSRTITATVTIAGGGTAKLCAYGFDKLNMLAESIKTITTTGTYGVTFTPRQHGNPLIPDPGYVLVWLDHNGVGSVDWSNISITVYSTDPIQPIQPPTDGPLWYTTQPAGTIVNNVQAPTGANQIDLYSDFAVSIQSQNVPVYKVNVAIDGNGYPGGGLSGQVPVGVCNFDITGSVTATVTVANRTVTSMAVKPDNYGVTATRVGNVITVPIPHPGKYILQINGSEDNWLCLFANPPEAAAPTGTVITYGPGIYTPGRVTLAANTTVWIKAGAVVRGSFVVPNGNITIRGRGILLAPSDANTAAVHMLETSGNHLLYEGVVLIQQHKGFMIRLPNTDTITIDNVKLFSSMDNSDGIDPTSARNVTVVNAFLCNWDDGLTIKSDPGPDVYNVSMTDSLIMTRSGWRGIGHGEEGSATHYNVTFKNIDMLWTHCMNLINMEHSGTWNPFNHDWLYQDIRCELHHGHNRTGVDPTAHFILLEGRNQNITFRNIYYTGPTLPPSGLNGTIDTVLFENINYRPDAGTAWTKLSNDSLLKLTRTGAVTNVTYA